MINEEKQKALEAALDRLRNITGRISHETRGIRSKYAGGDSPYRIFKS